MAKKTVAVFFGGKSNEHEISVITGVLAVNLLRDGPYTVIPVYLPREGGMATGEMRSVEEFRAPKPKWTRVRLNGRELVKEKGKRIAMLDVALNCCHGGAGEDGTLSALLAWNNIPSASPDTAVSSLFMDKGLGKIAAKGLSLPVLPSFVLREGENASERAKELGFPLIVKPSKLGSSIGIRVVKSEAELPAALQEAFALDDAVLVEKYLQNKRDLNCAAYRKGNTVVLSPVEEVFSDEDILTFSEKYEGRGARNSRLPAQIPEAVAQEVQNCTRKLYEAFSVHGVVRADFLLAENGLYFNELNTVPGSLACYLFGDSLLDAKKLLLTLIEEALTPKKERKLLVTGILRSELFSGAKGCKRR